MAAGLDTDYAQSSLMLLSKIQEGFTVTGGVAKTFVENMTALAIKFFQDAQKHKAKITSPDAIVFRQGLEKIREQAMDLIKAAEELEVGYDNSRAEFNSILKKTMKAVRRYVNKAYDFNLCSYKQVNVGMFVPIIIQNSCTHMALLISHCLSQSIVPIQVTMAPLLLDAQAASGQMQFVHYLSECPASIDDKMGPWEMVSPKAPDNPLTAVNLESDAGQDKPLQPNMSTAEPMDVAEKPDIPLAPLSSPARLTPRSPAPPSTAFVGILERIKAKKTLALPATPNAPTSIPSTPTRKEPKDEAKGDADNKTHMSPPAKKQKTDDDKAKVKASNVFDSSSKDLLPKSKSKTTKRKWTSKKQKSDALVTDSDSSDEEGSSKKGTSAKRPLQSKALLKQNSHHAKKLENNLHAVNNYRESKGIYSQDLKEPNFSNQLDYIRLMVADESLKFNIHETQKIYNCLKASTSTMDISNRRKLREVARKDIVSKSSASMEFLVECFVYPKTKTRIPKDEKNGYNSQVMLGLYGLHHHQAVLKITMSDTGLPKEDKRQQIMEGFCLFCSYASGNTHSLNNHIWMHEHLGLLCMLNKCFFVMHQVEKMYHHGKVVHSIIGGDPACNAVYFIHALRVHTSVCRTDRHTICPDWYSS